MNMLRMSLLLPLLLNACASPTPVPPLNLQATTPEITARYVTERLHTDDGHEHHEAPRNFKNEWLFQRSAQRIEVHLPAQQTGEVWLRDGKTVFYQKLFHADRKLLEYQLEDLSALNLAVNWRANELMIDPSVLPKLRVTDERWIDGHPALQLSGTVDAIDYEVVWLVDLNLPHRLKKRDASGNLELTLLLGLEQTLPSFDSQHYEIIDYADLGDRDPFVMKIQNHLIGGHQHSH